MKESGEWLFILGLGIVLIIIEFPLSVILVISLTIIWKLMKRVDERTAKAIEDEEHIEKNI